MRKRLSPGMVLGTVAVVFACTGSATAGSLITSGKIKDGTIRGRDIKKGTITTDRLASSVRRQLLKTGTPGPAGPKGEKGDTGATGATGPTLQASPPQKGDTGPAGKDGANPATLVASSGDAGWAFVGGGGQTSSYPSASFAGGELRLQGGFDGTTPSGAIGIAHAYNNVPLSSLSALSYDFRLLKRPAGDSATAPTIHVTVNNANTGKAGGFTNFVFEPYVQGQFGLNQRYTLDALAGKWWATRATAGFDQGHPASWADVINKNPDATISAISIDNGNSSSGPIPADQFAAGADNVIVGFGSSFTRYDFGG
jgi:hypothetical protein